MNSTKKYAAFISYRHLSPDMEIAAELHKMLEHNMVRPDRHSPRNIRPVFLDKGELPILEDLDAGILEALENSECLYVICSPNLPLSKYCMREISYFMKINGGSTRRIYTLLVDGDPKDAFPDILRRETRHVRGADGVEREETVDVEPLFADVRASSIKESIKKLRKTEFLRLAAAYYGCTYDSLYKRYRRWLLKIGCTAAAGVLAVAGAFSAYAHVRNMQYNAAEAAAYASYAEQQTELGDEMLALSLCEEGYDAAAASGSARYETALRSAVVQHAYKRGGVPVARAVQTSYLGENSDVFYMNEDGSITFLLVDHISQVGDAKTGAVYQRLPQDTLSIDTDHLDHYVTVFSVPDENGVYWDTLSLYSLPEHDLIASFPFRESGHTPPNYKLVTAVETDAVLMLTDNGSPVAYMTKDGQQLTAAEAAALMLATAGDIPEPDAPFSIVVERSAALKTQEVVKTSAGETVFTVPSSAGFTAFSGDWAHFLYELDDQIIVLDTQSWSIQATVPRYEGKIQSVNVLNDSTYLLSVYRLPDSSWSSYVYDWRTGQLLAEIGGYAHASPAGHAFYGMHDGVLSGYAYTPLDLSAVSDVVAQAGSVFLTSDGENAFLIDAQKGSILMSAPCPGAESIRCTPDLGRILIAGPGSILCYSGSGELLWQADSAGDIAALSEDGSLAAWQSAGGVTVANGADGSVLYTVSSDALKPADTLCSLAVSKDGLCAAGYAGALWLPADGGEPVALGEYDSAQFITPDLLVLESRWSYVEDFCIWSVSARKTVYRPADNTGAWRFDAAGGHLVRHMETSGNHAKPLIEVLRFENGSFAHCGEIPLPDIALTGLHLDSAGEYLSITTGKTTSVYRLSDLSLYARLTDCPLRYEGGRFWASRAYGAEIYSGEALDLAALHAYAQQALTSSAGMRTLSIEEQSRYSFD